MSFIDPSVDQAVQRRARRRQRHGRPGGAAAVRPAALQDDAGSASTSTARFPNHEANPLIEENRRDITEEVIRQKADVGIAWDGDADRCFFIDGSGEFISGDFITALLAEAFLLKHPGATIIYDLRASHAVGTPSQRYGGTGADEPRRPRVHQAADARGGRHLRRRSHRPLLLPRLLLRRQRLHPGAADPRADVEEEPVAARPAAAATASATSSPARSTPSWRAWTRCRRSWRRSRRATRTREIAKMDGVSVDYPDWHFNVRASNTEPLLRLNLEATTPELMEKKTRRGAGRHSRVIHAERDAETPGCAKICEPVARSTAAPDRAVPEAGVVQR